MGITREQCRAARAFLGWTQTELQEATKRAGLAVACKTIADFEYGNRDPFERTLRDLQKTFELNGIEFIQGSKGIGLRVKP
jgi:hypothetical protein